MSLLQGVLRPREHLEKQDQISKSAASDNEDSEDEIIGVMSVPGTPSRSGPPSRSQSPGPRARGALLPSTLGATRKKSSGDPLKVLPTDISQKIFNRLSIKELAKCAQVSKKWSKSQTLNYVWFQHYRKENFHDDSLPPGKWSKRESKANWRTTYFQSIPVPEPAVGVPINPTSRGSGYSTPSRGLGSGYQTPKEINEDKWRAEAEQIAKPGKVEMRDMYKELGGRKYKGKTKLGMAGGVRDKGGWGEED